MSRAERINEDAIRSARDSGEEGAAGDPVNLSATRPSGSLSLFYTLPYHTVLYDRT